MNIPPHLAQAAAVAVSQWHQAAAEFEAAARAWATTKARLTRAEAQMRAISAGIAMALGYPVPPMPDEAPPAVAAPPVASSAAPPPAPTPAAEPSDADAAEQVLAWMQGNVTPGMPPIGGGEDGGDGGTTP